MYKTARVRQELAYIMKTTDSKYQGWIVFGVFLLAFAVAWIAGAIWGIAATQFGRSLGLNDAVISTLSLLGIAVIRGVIWIPITRMVLKRRLWEMAFQFRHGWWQDLLVGIGISSLAISVIFLVAIKAGWSVIEGWIWQSQPSDVLLGKLWVSLLINALVAIVEEIAFRAYLLTGLKETWGKSIGLAVMAVTFSFMHAPALEGYPPFTIAYALLMMAAFGVMFGWVYLRTGFLWLPTGIHFA